MGVRARKGSSSSAIEAATYLSLYSPPTETRPSGELDIADVLGDTDVDVGQDADVPRDESGTLPIADRPAVAAEDLLDAPPTVIEDEAPAEDVALAAEDEAPRPGTTPIRGRATGSASRTLSTLAGGFARVALWVLVGAAIGVALIAVATNRGWVPSAASPAVAAEHPAKVTAQCKTTINGAHAVQFATPSGQTVIAQYVPTKLATSYTWTMPGDNGVTSLTPKALEALPTCE